MISKSLANGHLQRFLFCIILIIPFITKAQELTFKPLKSEGKLPREFHYYVQQTLHNIKSDSQTDKKFETEAWLGIHGLITSGSILFGDTVSRYINELAHEITTANNITDDLKFYVLRSTETNAFATDQGYIFVTVGALADSRNREELAFILCHEISHYLLKHNYQKYKRSETLNESSGKSKLSTEERVKEFFAYSRHDELEADSMGSQLYLKCGFTPESILQSLNNLDEINSSFIRYNWNFHYLEDPAFKFPTPYYQLDSMDDPRYYGFFNSIIWQEDRTKKKSKDDDDDAYSTHPDISVRISTMRDILKKSAGLDSFEITTDIPIEASFQFVHRLSQVDNLLSHFSSTNYVMAHYYTMILQQEWGASQELEFFKTLSLNNIYYKLFHRAGRMITLTPLLTLDNSDNWNVTHMSRFFHLLSNEEWLMILCRENMKWKEIYPENKVTDRYLKQSTYFAHEFVSFSFKRYAEDTVKNSALTHGKVWLQKNTADAAFDPYEVWNIRTEYLKHSFTMVKYEGGERYERWQEWYADHDTFFPPNVDRYSKTLRYFPSHKPKLSYKESREHRDSVLFLSPRIRTYRYKDDQYENDVEQNEQNLADLTNQIRSFGSDLNIGFAEVDLTNRDSLNTEVYNEHYFLEAWVMEKIRAASNLIVPVTSFYEESPRNTYGQNVVFFTYVSVLDNGLKDRPLLEWLTPVTFPVKWIRAFKKPRSRVEYMSALIDLDQDAMLFFEYEILRKSLTTDMLRAHVYDLMYESKRVLNESREENED